MAQLKLSHKNKNIFWLLSGEDELKGYSDVRLIHGLTHRDTE